MDFLRFGLIIVPMGPNFNEKLAGKPFGAVSIG